ncbi:protein LATERAL BRANCHING OXIDOREDUCTASE 1-like [Rutidosis leptorrhynchoides]|uniref:protein LATERAL BRANCHING OXIDOREDUCTASE 1-like n=1 Tax=Rutidosis leptorrhynchoides TaxID=125765 RepID=UPI003A99D538
MAEEPLSAAKLELASKTVQQLIIDGKLPERYFYKGSDKGTLDASFPLLDLLIVDVSLLDTSRDELQKLKSALSSCGCFLAINHGMKAEYLDKVRGITKKFFAFPKEVKQKYTREVHSIEGYGNDMVLSEHRTLDWLDRLYLTLSPKDKRKLEYWPEFPQDFRETLEYYTKKVEGLIEILLKAMARSLELEDNSFLIQYGDEAIMTSRFNLYPPCPKPDRVIGCKPHADGSAITILLQDKEVEGLQFLKDDQWFTAPIVPEALLVNIGDQIEIMSNGIFKSPMHRVVTNPTRERISVAVFGIPQPEQEIKPVAGLFDETRPKLYKKVTNYVDIYFKYYYQLGRRPIEAVII